MFVQKNVVNVNANAYVANGKFGIFVDKGQIPLRSLSL